MKSFCYVVLPDDLLLNDFDVYDFVRKHIMTYYSELEVEPYKKFFTEEETLKIAKRHGFERLEDFNEYLKTNKNDEGIENGLYYWITTYNTQGKWDAIQLEGIKKACDLVNDLPYSIVTPDGVWHSEQDYGYKPILDFEIGNLHSDNVEPRKNWEKFLRNFFIEYSKKNIAIMWVHS